MAKRLTLANRKFLAEDQEQFAAASGDRNPMHMDAVAARRTLAGAPVVHGIHLLLWALDALAVKFSDLLPIARLKVQFHNFVYVGDETEVVITQRDENNLRLDVRANDVSAVKIAIGFGNPTADTLEFEGELEPIPAPSVPFEPAFEQMANRSGLLAFAALPETTAPMFAAVAKWIGAERVAALAASSNLVGMVSPGLHSIFSGLALNSCVESLPQNALAFRTTEADPRFRLIEQKVSGGGWIGNVTSFMRVPPVTQPDMKSLAGLVRPTEFAGSVALVVGGSRGLGELTAKLIATGGGRVIITYQVGSADAENVAEEIWMAGGLCEVALYDLGKSAETQLAALAMVPTHLYYFATPKIFRSGPALFSETRFREFADVYVDSFWRLVKELHSKNPDLCVFYPSSVAVDERPKGMTEYTMAKAAGEILCADINETLAPLHVTVYRLPRLATDQTASVIRSEVADALKVMLPLVREVQLRRKT